MDKKWKKRKKEVRLEPVINGAMPENTKIPEIVIYRDTNFLGQEYRTNCNLEYVGEMFNDDVKSIIVVSGTWEIYKHAKFRELLITLKPGYYSVLEVDGISSVKCINF